MRRALALAVALAILGACGGGGDGSGPAEDEISFCADKAGVDDVVALAGGGDPNDVDQARSEVSALQDAAADSGNQVFRSAGRVLTASLLEDLDADFAGPSPDASAAAATIDTECDRLGAPLEP